MIAHSFKHPGFGPAQKMHGATYVVDVSFFAKALNDMAVVIDIALAHDALKEVLTPLNYQNLDELPQFEGKLTTTEFLAKYIHDEVKAKVAPEFTMNRMLREDLMIVGERLCLGCEGEDEAVCHGADDRDPHALPGQDVRRRVEPREVGGSRSPKASLRPVSASRAELGEIDSRPGREPDPGSLRGDERLKVDDRKQQSLDDLCLHEVPGHADDRFLREEDLPLVHRPDVAAETEVREKVEEGGIDSCERRKGA